MQNGIGEAFAALMAPDSGWDEQFVMLARLLVAGLAGGIIGWQRLQAGHRVGIRTMAVVSAGACIFTLASIFGFPDSDPARVAAQVATGVGFIGAGTIIFHRGAVRGLTTAASVWMGAALGLAAGAGLLVIALGGAILTAISLEFLPHDEEAGRRPASERDDDDSSRTI